MALPASETRYTFADYLTWDESERIELIGGTPVMQATPTTNHQLISGELFAQLHSYLKGKSYRVIAAPFSVRLFEQDSDRPEEVDTIAEPDLSVICDPSRLDSRGYKGAPDLIIEILSPSTQRHDRVVKYNLYQRAGVREYWIVDPSSKTVPVCLLGSHGFYEPIDIGTKNDRLRVNVLDNCFIDLNDVFSEA